MTKATRLTTLCIALMACRGPRPASDRGSDGGTPRQIVVPFPDTTHSRVPVPGDPDYPEFQALVPSADTGRHIGRAVLGLLKTHQRLVRLDAGKYAKWIRETEAEVRALMAVWCDDDLEGFRIDLGATTFGDLFPLELTEQATVATCGFFMVDKKFHGGRAWQPDAPAAGVTNDAGAVDGLGPDVRAGDASP
jgi:hypothetical protein